MLKEQLKKIKEKFNDEFKVINTIKIYSNHVPVNIKLKKLSVLSSRIRGAAGLVYDAMEAHCNDDFEVYASQATLAEETGYSREWVNHIINLLVEVGLITKLRRGLNKSNLYTLIAKKSMSIYINQIKSILIEMQKQKKEKSKNNNNYQKQRRFTDYEQRDYKWDLFEKVALGEMEVDDLSEITVS